MEPWIGEAPGRWHSGLAALDRDAGSAVVVLSATAASVDRQGFRLLQELTAGS